MAKGINKVILIGNLGADPEVRYAANGNPVANVRLATSESWKDAQTGQQQERTEWHAVVFFGKLAEIVGQYLKKGAKIYIEGKLQTRKWQDQNGQDRYSTEIVVDQRGVMQMLDGNQGGGGQQGGNQGGYTQGNRPQGGAPQQQNNRPQGNQPQQQGGYPQQGARPQGQPQQQGGYQQPQSANPQGAQPQQQGGYPQQAVAPGFDTFDDEIPF